MTTPLSNALETYIQALRAHAQTIESGASQTQVDPAASTLDDAESDWRQAVWEAAGDIEYPFGRDEDDDDFEDNDEEEGFSADSKHDRVSITARFDFIVTDTDAFTSFVRERMVADAPDCDEDTLQEHAGIPVAALDTLFSLDWKANGYEDHGLREAGGYWFVQKIPKALWEMTPEEQDGVEHSLGGGFGA